MSDTSIMSVRELVRKAFGDTGDDSDVTRIDFKLVQGLLHLIARQMRMLERKLDIAFLPLQAQKSTDTFISVTEVKVSTAVAKKQKRRNGKEKESAKATDKTKATTKGAPRSSSLAKISDDSSPESGKESTIAPQIKEKAIKDKDSSPKYTDDESCRKELATADSKKKVFDGQESVGQASGRQSTVKTITRTSSSVSSKVKKSDYSKAEELWSESPADSEGSFDVYSEKLLVMERLPKEAKEIKKPAAPRLSIVTKEEFDKLVDQVIKLENKLQEVNMANVGDMELMEEIGKTATLTDAIAAIQLSSRLDIVENSVQLLNDLAKKRPPPNISHETKMKGPPSKTADETERSKAEGVIVKEPPPKIIGNTEHSIAEEVIAKEAQITDATAISMQLNETQVKDSTIDVFRDESGYVRSQAKPSSTALIAEPSETAGAFKYHAKHDTSKTDGAIVIPDYDYATYEDLEKALQDVNIEFLKAIDITSNKTIQSSENAEKMCRILEFKLGASVSLSLRVDSLENEVAQLIQAIDELEIKLSATILSYQDQLTQLRYDLDIESDNVQEALQCDGGDREAIVELNGLFNALLEELVKNKNKQKNLDDEESSMRATLDSFWKELQKLSQTKADREEVAEGLRGKAGIELVNTLVALKHFDAVKADLEKRLTATYDKFSNQEIIWQKVIDDLTREVNEKAEVDQVVSLRENVNEIKEMFIGKIAYLLNLLGEPRKDQARKTLYRNAPCLSCANPARMKTPDYKQSKSRERKERMPEHGEGDGFCYPDQPIPHKLDLRGAICTKQCGSTAPTKVLKKPASINISALVREPRIGPDGTAYAADEKTRSCVPCNTASTQSALHAECKDAILENIECEVKLQ